MTVLHLTAFDSELRALATGSVRNLADVYFSGGVASDVYARMAEEIETVVNDVRGLGHVCFLTYGHPLFLVDTSWMLLNTQAFRVKALPGTSFLDRMMVDLGARFDYGCQHYEANRFMVLRPRLDPRTPLVISQVGEVGSDAIAERPHKIEWVAPLFDRIAESYPRDRRCDMIFSPYRSDMAPQVNSTVVGELQTLTSSVHTGSTLYVHGE